MTYLHVEVSPSLYLMRKFARKAQPTPEQAEHLALLSATMDRWLALTVTTV